MNKTMKDLTREVLAVQDACNLSGVAHGFARAMTELRALLPDAGTDAINVHPISVLWADKIAHLTETQHFGSDRVSKAYAWAHDEVSKC